MVSAFYKKDFYDEVEMRMAYYTDDISDEEKLEKTLGDECPFNLVRPVFLAMDECHKLITPQDTLALSQVREGECAVIMSTQNMTNIILALKSRDQADAFMTTMDNVVCLRTTDPATINLMKTRFGKVEKHFENKSHGESGQGNVDYAQDDVVQKNKSVSYTISEFKRMDEIFDNSMFTSKTNEHQAVVFLNSGRDIGACHLLKHWENQLFEGVTLAKASGDAFFEYTDYPSRKAMIEMYNNEVYEKRKSILEPDDTNESDDDGPSFSPKNKGKLIKSNTGGEVVSFKPKRKKVKVEIDQSDDVDNNDEELISDETEVVISKELNAEKTVDQDQSKFNEVKGIRIHAVHDDFEDEENIEQSQLDLQPTLPLFKDLQSNQDKAMSDVKMDTNNDKAENVESEKAKKKDVDYTRAFD